ncbi:thiol-disulfide oxidoreductase [Rubripirellula tenax]|uniref:Thiol-disulfide oxidoreductase n=1 Tax=Rubripirellula tenax TaxID=2528015 RepID=A0A5C6F7F3_9BACT|nr:redoxin family protein [Rubripirellula tenax]TWU56902.1 thiol-disulfide oxidoreductase [Rubripirellula tenax]
MLTLRFAMTAVLFVISGAALSAKEAAPDSPKVGDVAPDFNLPVVGNDDMMKLSDECKNGPVVVVVLRGFPGYQCPLCSRQVGALANRAKTIGEKASRIILVYPGEASMLDKHAEDFMGPRTLPDPIVMVRDPDMKMVDTWGLRWNAPRETAYPATFVLDENGKVAMKLVSDSHAGRSTADDIIRALKKL